MEVQNRWALFCAFLLLSSTLCVTVYFFIDRLVFLHGAQKTMAVVQNIEGVNSTCSRPRNCTKFYADMEFVALDGQIYQVRRQVGTKKGHNYPVTEQYQLVNEQMAWVYNPHNPNENFPDTFDVLWGRAVLALFAHLLFLLPMLAETPPFSSYLDNLLAKWSDRF